MAIIRKPAPGQLKADRMRMIYLRAEQQILKEITRKRNLGLVDYSDVAALQRVQQILRNMTTEAEEYAPVMIRMQFYGQEDFPSAPMGYENAGMLTTAQTAIVERLTENLMVDIETAAATAYESAEKFLALGRTEADKFRMLTLEEVARLEAEGKGWNTIQREMAAKLEAQGITSFVDKAGRKWGLTQYCSMATRTTQRQAQVAAALTADDWDLWQISKIGSTCPLCSVYEGRVYSKSGTDPDYPPLTMAFGKMDPAGMNDLSNSYLNIHPNCLVPGGSVLCEGIMSESRRFYSGEVITLQTSGGDKITVTPNHPILTERGFVAAGKIQKGDKIIKATRKYRSLIGKAPNNIDVPTVIDEKFHSVLKSLSGSTFTVKGSAVQFHGDGGNDSEVNVIFADSLREGIINALGSKPISEGSFPSTHCRWFSFFSESSPFKVLKRALHSFDSFMSRFGFIRSIKGISVNSKKLSDLGHGAVAFFSNLSVTHPLIVKFKESVKQFFMRFLKSFANVGKIFSSACARRFKIKFKFCELNISFRNVKLFSNLPCSEPLLKKRIKSLWVKNAFVESSVTHIDTSYYNGYVYNIETRYGFYVYNNIVTHNCLHTLIRYTTAGKTDEQIQRDKDFSSFEKRPANVDYRSKKQIEAYRKKEKDRAEFRNNYKQFKKYQAALGKDFPKTYETFEKHKKLKDDVYKGWEEKFRSLSSRNPISLLKEDEESAKIELEKILVPRNETISSFSSTNEIKEYFKDISFSDSFEQLSFPVQQEIAQGCKYAMDLFGTGAIPRIIKSEKLPKNTFAKTNLDSRRIAFNQSLSLEDALLTAIHEEVHLADDYYGKIADSVMKEARKIAGIRKGSNKESDELLSILGYKGFLKYRKNPTEQLAWAVEKSLKKDKTNFSEIIRDVFIRRCKNG